MCARAEAPAPCPATAACSAALGAWGEHDPQGRGAAPLPAPLLDAPVHVPQPVLQGGGSRGAWQSRATAVPVPARHPRGEATDCCHMRTCGFVTDLLHGWLPNVLCGTFPTSLDTL